MKEAIRISNCWSVFGKRFAACLCVMIFAVAISAGQARAMSFDTGDPNIKVSFDNTFTYSTMYRLSDQDPALIDTAHANSDDGDRNFDKGFVMSRLDLISELDIKMNKYGFRLSGQGWYDSFYNKKNDNDSPYTANASSVDYNEFTDETVWRHGKGYEIVDAFVFGTFDVGQNSQVSFKAGQHAVWWGTSFFPNDNGIAQSMNTIDVAKAASLPNVQMKELIRPVPQISFNYLINDYMSVAGYYQFQWKPIRLMASGSYFSSADLLIEGGERILAANDNRIPVVFTRGKDMEARDDGQFGISYKYQTKGGIDLGAYYLHYHDKGFHVWTQLDSTFTPYKYFLVYPEDIDAYAISANTSIGVWTVGTEFAYRTNVALQSKDETLLPGMTADNKDNPLYATGDTFHATLTIFNPGLPATFFSDTADFIFETAYHKRMSVDKNEDNLNKDLGDYGLRMKLVYTPKWYQALPAFDLTLPMGIEYAPQGYSSALTNYGVHKGGNWNLGIGGTYNNLWDMTLTYVNYYGDTDYQTSADRDYVGFYLRRAF